MDLILNIFSRIFNPARQFWEKEATHKAVSGMLVLAFLLALGAIELNRQGLVPVSWGETLTPSLSLDRFIAAKKAVALTMLAVFCGMGLYNGQLFFSGKPVFHFFQYFYTVLIFSDILLVLIAQAFLPEFPAIFRNSGYALATLLIRLSLTAPAYFNVLIGLSSVILAVLLTLVYNQFYTHKNLNTKR